MSGRSRPRDCGAGMVSVTQPAPREAWGEGRCPLLVPVGGRGGTRWPAGRGAGLAGCRGRGGNGETGERWTW